MARPLSVSLSVLVLIGGCATMSFYPPGRFTRHRAIEGRFIDVDNVRKLVPGSTTTRDVVERFGEPDHVEKIAAGVDEYVYAYTGVIEKTTERIVWASKDTTNEAKNLRIVFDHDVVQSFTYTNSAEPKENLAKGSRLPANYVVLLPKEDGGAGSVEVAGSGGRTLLAEPWKAAALAGGQPLVDVSEEEVKRNFKDALAAIPKEPSRFVLYFENDSTTLTADSRKLLPQIVEAVRDHPVPDVDVVGHTDTVGSNPYNDTLALRRAEKIADEVVGAGVDRKMIEVSSRGKRDLLVKTADGVREPRNRRVEVIVR